jgi:hypothetical protein
MFKIFLILVAALAVEGCASTRPVLYPNEYYNSVGPTVAKGDIANCMHLAEVAGADSSSGAGNAAVRAAGGTAIGAAAGAVGGAVVGSAGSGAAIGAATGATAGLLNWIFGRPQSNPAYVNFVNRCLLERGYEPVGWE